MRATIATARIEMTSIFLRWFRFAKARCVPPRFDGKIFCAPQYRDLQERCGPTRCNDERKARRQEQENTGRTGAKSRKQGQRFPDAARAPGKRKQPPKGGPGCSIAMQACLDMQAPGAWRRRAQFALSHFAIKSIGVRAQE